MANILGKVAEEVQMAKEAAHLSNGSGDRPMSDNSFSFLPDTASFDGLL